MPPIAVIDFETTGISPGQGARATEVAIVLLEQGQVVDRFQSLMKTGAWIPPFITQLTGITNAMVNAAPDAAQVMQDAARFVGDAPMVAHNAAFDSKFWQAELALVGLTAPQPFACTVLLSRRLYPQAPSHKLGTLVDYHGLPLTGRWPMPRWRPRCWRACSTTCVRTGGWQSPATRCCKHCSAAPGPRWARCWRSTPRREGVALPGGVVSITINLIATRACWVSASGTFY